MLKTERKAEQKVIEFQEVLDQTDTVLIGAGAGLSTAAGFAYGGEPFRRYFADFDEKYGFHDMYSGGFYPFPTLEEHWAYWSRFVFLNRYCDHQAGIQKPVGAGEGQRLFCPYHQRGSLLSKSRI
ncbi:MAG: hypothetical protein ACLVDB_03055 [Anaeromassilibacillus sp.]